jgi:acyl carrier protein
LQPFGFDFGQPPHAAVADSPIMSLAAAFGNKWTRPRIGRAAPFGCVDAPPLNSPAPFAIRAVDFRGVPGGSRRGFARTRRNHQDTLPIKDLPMSSTFDTVVNIIAETCDIPRETIKPESHAINDLGIDSLDFLDVAFAIDKTFGIKMPIEQWTQEVNEGRATTEQYFVLENLCARIDELVAAKKA